MESNVALENDAEIPIIILILLRQNFLKIEHKHAKMWQFFKTRLISIIFFSVLIKNISNMSNFLPSDVI